MIFFPILLKVSDPQQCFWVGSGSFVYRYMLLKSKANKYGSGTLPYSIKIFIKGYLFSTWLFIKKNTF